MREGVAPFHPRENIPRDFQAPPQVALTDGDSARISRSRAGGVLALLLQLHLLLAAGPRGGVPLGDVRPAGGGRTRLLGRADHGAERLVREVHELLDEAATALLPPRAVDHLPAVVAVLR